MSEETDKLYARLAQQSTEIENLRQGYVIVNRRYGAALESLKLLSASAREAVVRADIAAQEAARSAKHAASVASDLVAKASTAAAAVAAAALAAAAATASAAAEVIEAEEQEAEGQLQSKGGSAASPD